jgi:hypothetical protein
MPQCPAARPAAQQHNHHQQETIAMAYSHDTTQPQDQVFTELMDLFTERTYWQRLRLMFSGLGQPHDTREYKLARTELQRQLAPAAAIIIPAICVVMLAFLADASDKQERLIETEILKTEEVEEVLEEIVHEELPLDDIQPLDIDFTPEIAMSMPTPGPAIGIAGDGPVSPQPATFDTVLKVRSPVILRNIYGQTRNAGTIGVQTGGVGKGTGNQATERSVMRALRWLKKKQNKDGSWGPNRNAMTSLAILCYLAHGEKPGSSEEFGETVQRGIEYLLGSQPANGQWRGNYEHYIATYALCEAYGMTMNPNVKSAIDRAVKLIIDGQHPSGGWDYALKQNDRDDTSVMGWAAQALKAAMMADFYSDPEALNRASKLSVKGFQKNAHPNGGFGYTSPARGGLTSVGTLGMQFHFAGHYPEVKKALELMETWKPVWVGNTPALKLGNNEKPPNASAEGVPPGGSSQYYFYYATQAKFQVGGSTWDKWNAEMWREYVKAQFVEEKAIADHNGVMQDIGWWVNSDNHSDRPVMDTCLAALQLMVYYRYLPTFKSVSVPEEVAATAEDRDDIKVDINL